MPYDPESHLSHFSMTQRELFRRLHWLIQMRWIGLAGLLIGLSVTHLLWIPFQANSAAFFTGLAGSIFAYNLVFTIVHRRFYWRPSSRGITALAFAQITADLAALSLLAFWTGGVHSVFIVFFGTHLAVAGILLKPVKAYSIALLACLFLDTIACLESCGHCIGVMPGIFLKNSPAFQNPENSGVLLICLVCNAAFLAVTYLTSSISERLRQSERQIEEMNRGLSAVNTAKSDFMRTASHEMRGPLTAVKGLLHMMGSRLRRDAPPEELLDLIARGENRLLALSDLIEDLLHYSHLHSTVSGERARNNLAELTAEVIEELQPLVAYKGLSLELRAEPCEVLSDREQMFLLARNLVGNAVRYTPENGNVRVRVFPEGDDAVLEVKDTGIGIDRESMDHIFEEFFRAPEAKRFEPGGTGLGLTLCKEICERHGGSIQAESIPERGSVFTARLPLASAGF